MTLGMLMHIGLPLHSMLVVTLYYTAIMFELYTNFRYTQ